MAREGSRLTAVDLFCGAGGLSLGLRRARFDVVAAVEIDPELGKTYKANHSDTHLFIRDVRELTGKDILSATGVKRIDMVVGCPPCQGFSSLTTKHEGEDPRNELVLEMARIVAELEPMMVMMENVPGLATRGKRLLDEFVVRLQSTGYVVNHQILELADYGVPQSRRRLVLLAGKGFPIAFPKPTHCRNGDNANGLKRWRTLADAIRSMGKPVTLSKAKEMGGPQRFNWHVVSDLTRVSVNRLRALRAGSGRAGLPKELRPRCHADSDEGFQNVYGRLSWNRAAPTITTGFATPAMGRFGHPTGLRTISVREAAVIQTFPKSYKFDTKLLSRACDLVGNALPPRFAEVVSRACAMAMKTEKREAA